MRLNSLPTLISHAAASVALALTLIIPASVTAAPPSEIRFGSVAMDKPPVMARRLSPLTKYLERELGVPVSLNLSPNMKAAITSVASGTVEIAYLTPVAYIRSHAAGNTRLIAKTITKGRSSFKLMIVVPQDSPIQSVAELKGKRFAFGDKAALLQRATVVGAGLPLEDLGTMKFLGHYDNIVRAVINKDFDAGILKDTMAYNWNGNGLRILYSSPNFPPYNIAASSDVDNEMFKKLQKAFLSLDKNKPEHLVVIKALDKKYDGFAPTDDDEYDVIRKLIAPFDEE